MWVCGSSLDGTEGSNPQGTWKFVCGVCCVFSDTVLGVGLNTRPQESYRICV